MVTFNNINQLRSQRPVIELLVLSLRWPIPLPLVIRFHSQQCSGYALLIIIRHILFPLPENVGQFAGAGDQEDLFTQPHVIEGFGSDQVFVADGVDRQANVVFGQYAENFLLGDHAFVGYVSVVEFFQVRVIENRRLVGESRRG